jgi:hypothetical protein
MKRRQRESYAKCGPLMQQAATGQIIVESANIATNDRKTAVTIR